MILIPNCLEFSLLLFVFFFTIFFTPIFQGLILQLESFVMYPFVCPKCCCFWMNLIINIYLAYLINPWFILWGGIFSAAIAYIHIYTDKHLPN